MRERFEEIDWGMAAIGCGCAAMVLCLAGMVMIVVFLAVQLFGFNPIP